MAATTDEEKKLPDWWYQPKYQEQMDSLASQIENRPAFRFNVNQEVLYDYYRGEYDRQGRQEQMDTQARGAGLTGGYDNSYARMAGQQVYEDQMDALGEVSQSLYDQAVEKYVRDGNALVDQYEDLRKQEEKDYKQWQKDYKDQIEAWEEEQEAAEEERKAAEEERKRQESATPQAAVNRILGNVPLAAAPSRNMSLFAMNAENFIAANERLDDVRNNVPRTVYVMTVLDAMEKANLTDKAVTELLEHYGITQGELDWRYGPQFIAPGVMVDTDTGTPAEISATFTPHDSKPQVLQSQVSKVLDTSVFSGDNFAQAVSQMRIGGVPNNIIQGLLSKEDWEAAAQQAAKELEAGKTDLAPELLVYNNYTEYMRAYVLYSMSNRGEDWDFSSFSWQYFNDTPDEFRQEALRNEYQQASHVSAQRLREMQVLQRENEALTKRLQTVAPSEAGREQDRQREIYQDYGNIDVAAAGAKLEYGQVRKGQEYIETIYRVENASDFSEKSQYNEDYALKADYSDVNTDPNMTERELAVYNYLFATEGKNAANAFLDTFEEERAQRHGQNMAGAVEGNYFGQIALKGVAGIGNFARGMAGLAKGSYPGQSILKTATGISDFAQSRVGLFANEPLGYNAAQYAGMYVNEQLADVDLLWYDFAEKRWQEQDIGGRSLGQVTGDLAETVGNMLPSMAVGGKAGLALMGASAAGNAYQDMLSRGYTTGQAMTYGVLSGLSEVILEKALGGISRLGGGRLPTKMKAKLAKVDNVLSRFAKSKGGTVLLNAWSEAKEEAVQAILEPYFNAIVTGEEFTVDMEETLYSALMGFVTGGMFEGVNQKLEGKKKGKADAPVDTKADTKNLYGEFQQELVTEALEINPENSFAQKMQDKLDKGKNLSGSELNKLIQQNDAAIGSTADMKAEQPTDMTEKVEASTPSQAVTEQEAEEEWVDLPTFEGPVESEAEREAREEEARRAELSGANVLGPWVAGALEDFRQRGSISYMSAILIGSDPQSVRKLTELTGVQIPEGDSAARQAAIEEAVSALAEQPIENFQSSQRSFQSEEDAAWDAMVREYVGSEQTAPAEVIAQAQIPRANQGTQVEAPAANTRNSQAAESNAAKTQINPLTAASKKYGAQAAVMESAYQEGQDVERFDREYKLAYDLGKEGASRELLDGGAFAYLTAEQKNAAYQSGAAAAENAGIVAEAVKSLGITGESAGVLERSFNANQITAKDYAMGLQEAYDAGKTGIPMKEAGSHAAKLTDAQRQIAYKQGQKAGGRQVAKQQAQVRKNRSAEGADTSKGKVHFDGDRSSLNKTQRASLNGLEVLAKTLGVQIYVEDFEGTKNANKNGWYDPKDGSIHINLKAGMDGKGTMIFTAAHELTHFIRQWSPAKFRVLANFVTKRYADKGISVRELMDDQIAKAKEDGRELTDEEALEEVVADSMETMLVDGSIMEMMAEIRQQDHGLWAKIKKWFRDFASKLQSVVDAYKGVQPDSTEGRMVADMKDMIGTLQALYMDALVDASENFDAGVQKFTTEHSGGVKYSLKDVAVPARGELEKKPPIKVIDISTPNTQGTFAQRRKQILENAEKVISKPYLNRDTNTLIFLTKQSYTHAFNNLGDIQLNAAEHLPELIENAVLTHAEGPTHGSDYANGVYTFFAAARANHIMPVKLKVKEYVYAGQDLPKNIKAYFENNPQGYAASYDTVVLEVEEIEKSPSGSAKDMNQNDSFLSPDELSTIKVADLLKLVKGDTEKYIPKFSNRDSDGSQLSEEQQEYFKDSKERDNQGRLRVMYRGDSTEVTVFDRKKSSYSNLYGRGFYFTNSASHAGQYGQAVAYYLNITNPVSTTDCTITKEQMRKFLEAVAENEDDYSFENYGYGATAESVLKGLYTGKSDFAMLYDVSQTAIGDMVEAVELFNKTNGTNYDGFILDTETVIFNSAQAKRTDNHNPTANPDTRYSQRDVGRQEAVTQALEKENAKLREDVAELRELVKLQRQVTNGTKFTKTSVEAAARYLKQNANAKGDTKGLMKLLNSLYEYIASTKELTWEGVKEQAQGAVDWLWEHIDRQGKPTEYAQDILKQLHGARVYLDESQMAEAAYRFGSYEAFRKGLMGNITLAKNANTSLDSLWAEMAQMYPDVFDGEISAADMPSALMDIIHRLRSPDTTVDYARNRELMEQDLLREIYDSYWRVSTLYTAADVGARRINKLKSEHYQRMEKLKQQHRETIDRLKQEHQARLEQVRKDHRAKLEEKVDQVTKRYQDARKQNVEGRKKTEQRRKIRKTIRELSKLLTHGTKERNVKEGMKDFVSTAIASAEVLFTDEYTNEDMVRNGVECECEGWESSLIDKTRALIRQRDDLLAGAAIGTEVEDVIAGDPSGYEARMKEVRKLDGKISENMGKLKGVFARERSRLNKATASSLLNSLAEEYWKLGTADEEYIRGALDENVHQHLMNLSKEIGGTTVKDMSLSQLEQLHKAYTMVLTTVRNANKSFADNLKGSRMEQAKAVTDELAQAGKKRKKQTKGQIARAKRSWNNLKSVFAFERIGSGTLKRLYENLRSGEDTWMVDMDHAREHFLKAAKDSGYNGWDLNKQTHSFESSTGLKFDLNLGQIMSIYAYARRGQQALDHLMKGGFVFDKYTEERVTEHGIPKTYLKDDATAYNLSLQTIQEIIGKLTPEQRAFVETMQDYLSDTMGAKGNEVSMKLYGVKLFGEKFYFPLRSSGVYLSKAADQEQQKQQGQVSIKNAGFAHSTTPNAADPVVLSGFMDVWANHVNDMSMYHAFVLPMEDFNKVYNYSTPHTEEGQSGAVKQAIINAHGSAATDYINQFIRDLNGGVVADPREGQYKAWISKFKKASVMASASVVIQQPTAIVRALAYIDAKYFGAFSISRGIGRALGNKVTHNHTKLYDELKKYAPVAAIKQMGRFDTDMGMGAADYLTAKEFGGFKEKAKAIFTEKGYLGKRVDEITGFLAERADEITWAQIWQAVKKEVADKQGLKFGSEEHLKAAGKRFTEVITRTQVYDSVFSRSANMRSKGAFMTMATSFMAEPTTTANMLTDAIRKAKQGDVKHFLRVGASVAGSIIFNNILRSAVYAMRDDDEDETFVEKYSQALASGMLDDLNPMSYLPFWRDVWSLAQGYDVERADMSVIATLIDAGAGLADALAEETEGMTEEQREAHGKKVADRGWKLVDSLASAVGLPAKNLRRDILGAVNFFDTIKADSNRSTTAGSLKDKVWEDFVSSVPGVNIVVETDSKTDNLYDAIVAGDAAYVERLKSGYKSDDAYTSAMRKGLRENDGRIRAAAVAWVNDDLDTYMTIAKEVIGEGNFLQDDVVAAIQTVVNELTPDQSSSSAEKHKGLFNANAFAVAISQDDTEMAKMIQADIVRTAQRNGKTEEEAEKSFISSVTSACKKMFGDGELTEEQAINALTEFCDKDEDEAKEKVAYWEFQNANPQYEDWSQDTVTKYKDLEPDTAAHVIEVLGGLSAEDGYTSVRPVQKLEAIASDRDLSAKDKETALRANMDSNLEAKYDTARNMGISMGNFVKAYRKYQDTSGEGKKATVIAYYKKTFGISNSKAEDLYDLFVGKK